MRLRFIIAYDGRAYSGWQSQRSANTIQDILEKHWERSREDTSPCTVQAAPTPAFTRSASARMLMSSRQ